MKIYLSLLIILSSISLSKFNIEYEENDSSFVLIIHGINELNFNTNSVYHQPPTKDRNFFGLNIPLAIDLENVQDVISNDNLEVKLNTKGIVKGVEIVQLSIIPKDTIISTVKCSINFKNKVQLSSNQNIPNKLLKVLNRKQLQAKLEKTSRKKSFINSLQISESDWMIDGINYVKISTQKDGITNIPASSLIPFLGINKKIENIHFSNKANDYSYFYINSDDDIFSNDDTIYLLSKHQRGDSTYYNHFSDNEFFYIYYDESKTATNLTKLVNQLPSRKTETVTQEIHLEEDRKYSLGLEVLEIESGIYEGWYADIINPRSESFDEYSYVVDLFLNNNNNVLIRNNYSHLFLTEYSITKYKNLFNLSFLVNGMLVDSTNEYRINYADTQKDFWKSIFTYESELHPLMNGPNKLSIRNNFINDTESALLGVDYFTIRSNSIPVLNTNMIHFNHQTNQKEYTEIYNFKSNEIVAIDTANNSIQFPSHDKSNIYSAGINSEFVGLKINNSKFYKDINNQENAYVHYLYVNDESISTGGSTNNSEDILEILNSQNQKNVIIGITSSTNNDIINNLNSTLNINLISGTNTVIIIDCDGNIKTFDGENYATGNHIVKSSNASNYSGKILINEGVSSIIASDSDNFADYKIHGIRSKSNDIYNTDPAEIVLIYYDEFVDFTNKWEEYRTNQGFSVRTVNVEDIYDSFSAGEISPIAIKEFLKYAYSNWEENKLEYVFLVGDGTWDPKYHFDNSVSLDQIPVYGRPYSDMWYGMLDNENQPRFDLAVTRLSAKSNEEAIGYLNKVKDFESLETANWFKKFVLLVGGYEQEQSSFQEWNDNIFKDIVNSQLNIDTVRIYKSGEGTIDNSLGNQITSAINGGAIWTSFLGHGAFDGVDVGGWGSNNLNNNGRTGILSTVSCNNGAFAEPSKHRARNEDQVLVPEKGFVGAFGGTATGELGSNSLIMQRMLNFVTDTNYRLRRLSDVLYLSLDDYFPGSGLDKFVLTYNFIGDPLLELPISKYEDYYFFENSLSISSSSGSDIIDLEEDSATVKVDIYNSGYELSNPIIKLYHSYNNIIDTINIGNYTDLNNQININLFINNKIGKHDIRLIIDEENIADEIDLSNNTLISSFNVFDKNIIALDPISNWNLNKDNIMRFLNPYFDSNIKVEAEILGGNQELVIENKDIKKNITTNYVDLIIPEILDNNSSFFVKFRSNNQSGWTNYNTIKFTTTASEDSLVNYDILLAGDYELKNLKYLQDSKSIIFDTTFKEYDLISMNGINTPFINATIMFDNALLIEDYQIGYYMATLNKYSDSVKPQLRHFNTFGWYYPPDKEAYYIDSMNFEMINYLKDTLQNDEYVLIASSGFSASQFLNYCNDNFCHSDTLVDVFKNLGSNSFTKDWVKADVGYCLVSGKTLNNNFIKEDIKFEELSNLKGELPFYPLNGTIKSKLIGPAKSWKNINIGFSGVSTILINIYDSDNNLIKVINGLESFDLSDISADYLRFEINFERENENSFLNVNKLDIQFIPKPELGVETVTNSDSNLLRGEEYSLNLNLFNYSLRTNADSVFIDRTINNGAINSSLLTSYLSKNTEDDFDLILDTKSYELLNQISFNLSDSNIDIHTFNNSSQNLITIYEDTIPPNLAVKLNNQVLSDGDFIPLDAEIIVEFYDNSPLAVDGLSNFDLLRFNGFLDDNEIEFSNDFDHKESNGLKARLVLPNERIRPGLNRANLLQIEAFDASNNRDTLFMYLNVTENGDIINPISYPNPFNTSSIIKFDILSPIILSDATSIVNIYDSNGNFIRQLKSETKVGTNELLWDGKDSSGNSIPNGRYYYLIMIQSDTHFPDGKTGISIKVN
ncbi:C25 family cysteine peptidase [Candidatus Kapabacteria bacterium]|nr:C25 family cysteine peptidase [Candidatus Kapabacteria bacterium]